MEYDGRDIHNERGQRDLLLRLEPICGRPRDLPVRPTFPAPKQTRFLMDHVRTNPKHNPILQEYVLPDFSTNRRGHVRKPDEMASETDQVLYMGNERFSVPEILFRPDDIGNNELRCQCLWHI